jgi:hypothetical protein
MVKRTTAKQKLTIELGRGATYSNNSFTVYAHDRYPRHSVLAGQNRRTFIDRFDTLAEAQKEFPAAVHVAGTTYAPPSLFHLSDDGDL